MFSDYSVFQFLIYAAGIGFAAAIIYTNIQRTALSRFINFLAENNCFDSSCAVSLSDTGLSGIQQRIVKSAVIHQHGFKRIIGCVNDTTITEKDEDAFFEKIDSNKYYLSTDNVDETVKKYSFKTMSTKLVILFVAALAAVVIITSIFTSWLIETVSTPKIENSEENIEEEITAPKDENTTEDTGDDIIIESEDDTAGPRIPV